MTHSCQVTEISNHDFPELIQFYQHSPKKYPFLLTTSSENLKNSAQQQSNFDILFIEPKEWLKLDSNLQISSSNNIAIHKDELFLDVFDRLFSSENNHFNSNLNINSELNSALDIHLSEDLPFRGGWFLFLAYEMAQQIETCLNLKLDKQLLPVAYAARVKTALVFDHKKAKLFLISEADIDHEEVYQALLDDIKVIKLSRANQFSMDALKHSLHEEESNAFLKSVDKVKQYIKDGDVFQVNLSRHWHTYLQSLNHTQYAYLLSQILSKENPAPFSGLASFDSQLGMASIISSSPERLLKVNNNRLESRPIAGTHPRGVSAKEDQQLLDELHAHPKEQAEHIMLIDLIRNDLGRVCIPGTVIVDELMVNESYAHVHHIVSNVSGDLQADKTPGDIIKAMFPGGTITGCPKVRCMEIINELEQCSRGAYTGSMGYINLDGSMDLNILIRTMVLDTVLDTSSDKSEEEYKHKLSFRAGAGLVFDSIAENELRETRAKAKGLLRTLEVSSA